MIGFTKEHRQRFRVRLEEVGLRADPYAWIILGRLGNIYVHGDGRLGVSTHNARGVVPALRRLPFVKVVQDGSDGINATFPADQLKIVARIVKSRRRRRLSPEQRAILRARCSEMRGQALAKSLRGRFDDQRHHPDRPLRSGAAESHISPGLPAGA